METFQQFFHKSDFTVLGLHRDHPPVWESTEFVNRKNFNFRLFRFLYVPSDPKM